LEVISLFGNTSKKKGDEGLVSTKKSYFNTCLFLNLSVYAICLDVKGRISMSKKINISYLETK
jgi:hypothetical protein